MLSFSVENKSAGEAKSESVQEGHKGAPEGLGRRCGGQRPWLAAGAGGTRVQVRLRGRVGGGRSRCLMPSEVMASASGCEHALFSMPEYYFSFPPSSPDAWQNTMQNNSCPLRRSWNRVTQGEISNQHCHSPRGKPRVSSAGEVNGLHPVQPGSVGVALRTRGDSPDAGLHLPPTVPTSCSLSRRSSLRPSQRPFLQRLPAHTPAPNPKTALSVAVRTWPS